MRTIVICNACGHMMESHDDTKLLIECEKCGRMNKRPAVTGEVLERFKRASELRKQLNFKEAYESYKLMLNAAPDDVDGLWGRLLSQYGVHCEVEHGRRIWQIHTLELSASPMRDTGDFHRIQELLGSDPERRKQFEIDAENIDRVIIEIRRLAMNARDYDIFLCHKTTGKDGKDTVEYQKALRLYKDLTRKGFHVFFAPVELQATMAGANYEAGIYKALYSAKVMLVVCAEKEYMTSQWVYSEWSRFMRRMDTDSSLRLVPVLYPPMKPDNLPPEFVHRSLNAITMNPEREGTKRLNEMLRPYAPLKKPWRAAVALAIAVVVLAGAAAVYMMGRGGEEPSADPVVTATPAAVNYRVRMGDSGEDARMAIDALKRLYYLEGEHASFDSACVAAFVEFCGDNGLATDTNVSEEAFLRLVMHGATPKTTPMIAVETGSAALNGDGNVRTFTVTSNGAWTAQTNETWIHLSEESGNGNAEVTVNLDVNPSDTQSRMGAITFACGTAVQTVTLTQERADSIAVTIPEGELAHEAGRHAITVKANGAWTATTDADWITFIEGNSGTEDATVLISAAANPSVTEARTGEITFTCGTASQNVQLTQAKADHIAARAAEDGTIPAAGMAYVLNVEANGAWKATTNAAWIQLDQAGGECNGAITATILPNEDVTRDREDTITFTCGTAVHTATLHQAKADRIQVESSVSGMIPAAGETYAIKLEANGGWTAETKANWIHLDQGNGSGDVTVTATIDENTDIMNGREGTITFTCGTATQTVTITQAKTDYITARAAEDGTIPAAGMAYVLNVEANGKWKATTEAAWIQLDQAEGDGSDNVTATIQQNTDVTQGREGTITFTCGTATQTVTIHQAKADSIVTTARDGNHPHEGGSWEVQVEANGPWTASAEAAWISLEPEKGSGDGSVLVTLEPNADVTQGREGTITFTCGTATQTVTLRQAKADSMAASAADSSEIPAAGEDRTITVKANGAWKATTEASWIQLDRDEGEGDATVTATILKNTDITGGREGTITFTCGTATKTVTIAQAKADHVEAKAAEGGVIPAAGADRIIEVEANGAWSVQSDVDWIQLDRNGGNGAGDVKATILQHADNTTSRTGTITFTCGTAVQKMTITQARADRVAAGAADAGPIPATGAERTIHVEANGAWTAETKATWIHLNQENGSGDVTVTATIDANTDITKGREGTITFTCGDAVYSVLITQEKADHMAVTAGFGGMLSALGEEHAITVEANGAWTAVPNVTWIGLDKTAGEGDDCVTVTIAENMDATRDRDGKITFTCGNAEQTVTIRQAKADSITAQAADGSEVSATGGERLIGVEANGTWTAESNVNWIRVDQTSDGVTAMVDANTDIMKGREGTITFTCGTAEQVVTIRQAKADSITAQAADASEVSATGGERLIGVEANGAWTAESSVNWIRVDQTSEGVKATITANTDTASGREGTITFTCGEAEQVVTIRQAKADSITAQAADSSEVSATGGERLIGVEANGAWEAKSNADWIRVDQTSASVKATITENTDITNGREGTITFTCGAAEQVVTIRQAKADSITVTPGEMNIDAAADSIAISVKANGDWEAACIGDWISLDQSSGHGEARTTVRVEANASTTDDRTGSIIFTCGTAEYSLSILQMRADMVTATPDYTDIFSAQENSCSVGVKANGAWTAETTANWIVLGAENGEGDGSITVTVLENTSTTASRTGGITFRCGDAEAIITIQQAKKDMLEVTVSDEGNVGCAEGACTIKVKANGPWTAQPGQSWIKLGTSSWDGNQTIIVNVGENPSVTSSRTGTIVFNCGSVSQTVTITQAKKDSIKAPESRTIAADEQKADLAVRANGAWEASSDVSWIQLEKTEGSGNETIVATIAANTSIMDAREGTITFTCGIASDTMTITQARKDHIDVPAGRNAAAAGQDVTFHVDANGEWTATADATWIRLDSEYGSGDADVKATILANASVTDEREGKITFTCGAASDTMTIRQAKKDRVTAMAEATTVTAEQKTISVAVEANGAWTASADVGWIHLDKERGSGDDAVEVTILANESITDGREGKITFICGTATETVTIAQAKKDYITAASVGSMTAERQVISVAVTANGAWSATSDADWIQLDKGSGDDAVKVTILANESTTDGREGKITFTCGTATQTVTITQAKKDYITAASVGSMTADRKVISVAVTANGAWSATPDADWIQLDKGSGVGDDAVEVTILANESITDGREGTITFICGTARKTVIVTQAKKDHVAATVTDKTPTAQKQDIAISVKANGSWSAQTKAEWIHLDKTNGAGDTAVTASLSANSSTTEARQGTITFTCGTATQTVTITQEKAGSISISPAGKSVSAEKQEASFRVTSNGSWTAESDASWITLETTSGSSGATVKATIAANTSETDDRTGTITFTCGTAEQTLTITQKKMDTLSLSPSSQTVSADKQTVSVIVTSNGSWTAESDSNWIRLDKANGNGGATVKATVAANTSTSGRTGTITFTCGTAEQTLTITQKRADSVSLSLGTKTVNADQQTVSVTVTSSGTWTAESDVNWITLKTASGSSGGAVKATVAANTSTTNSRVGKITITCGTATKTVTITQEKKVSFSATPDSSTVTSGKQTVEITVKSNAAWRTTLDVIWIDLDKPSGNGDATVTATIPANTSTSERTGKITFTCGTITKTVTITQKADSVSLSPASKTVGADKQTVSITVTSSGNWTATSSASWITLDKASGSSGAKVNATVAANTSTTSGRTGKITFKCGTATKTVTITQEKQASPFNVVLKAPSWNTSLNDRAVPVYSGPGTNYYRAANSKAECTTRDGFYLWGCVNVNGTNWYMITYETTYPTNRTGYIKQGTFSGTLRADALKFANKAARTTREVELTDDPFGTQPRIFTLKKGTDVTYLGTYTNNGETWYYVECTASGKKTRGFIPEGTLEVK